MVEEEEEEKKRNEIVDYHGTPLIRYEYDVLMALENKVGQIPAVSEVKRYPDTFGFVAQDNHIAQLGFYGKRLTSLPESIGNLTSLKILDLDCNKLKSLPESIGNLNSLKVK